mgnify:FL=1|jgi:hypothetical protein|tara:strand:+ start:1021 stop:1245 length:225 start_codon:yes stop_codon:yes gene_type:complete
MAWVDVPGSNNIWQYENTATASNTYSDAAGTYSGGVRSYTRPGTGTVEQTYVRCRKKGETVERGELSKNFYDAQ